MEEILKQIDLFISYLSQAKGEIVKAFSAINDCESRLNNRKNELDAQQDNIKEREKNLEKIESVVALRDEAKILMQESRDKTSQLQKDRDNFENYKIEQNKLLRIRLDECSEQEKAIKNEYVRFNKEKEQLIEDKKSYKDKLAQGLVNLAQKG